MLGTNKFRLTTTNISLTNNYRWKSLGRAIHRNNGVFDLI